MEQRSRNVALTIMTLNERLLETLGDESTTKEEEPPLVVMKNQIVSRLADIKDEYWIRDHQC